MDPDDFQGQDGLLELRKRCFALAARGSEDDIAELRGLLRVRARGTEEKHYVPRIAVEALLRLGPRGVQDLREALNEAPGISYPKVILEGLWLAAEGKPLPIDMFRLAEDLTPTYVDAGTRTAARIVLDDLIVESQSNSDLFDVVLGVAQQDQLLSSRQSLQPGMVPPPSSFPQYMMRVLAESSIILTRKLLDDFAALIEANRPERDYQVFWSNILFSLILWPPRSIRKPASGWSMLPTSY